MSNPDSANVDADQLMKSTVAKMQSAEMQRVGSQRPLSARMTVDNVREAFTYAPWDQEQVDAGKQVTEALIAAAETILRVVPESPLRTRAINGLFDARMIANAAITHRGKF